MPAEASHFPQGPLVDADPRCLADNATGVAGVWGNKNACGDAEVDLFPVPGPARPARLAPGAW